MCVGIVSQPVCNAINLKLNLIFKIKLLVYMTKKSRQKLQYFENKNNFYDEIKKKLSFLKDFQLQKMVSDLSVSLEQTANKIFKRLLSNCCFSHLFC